jgi:hypothetical protein
MDVEALIAATMKRRIANGLGVRIIWKDGSQPFTKFYATIADRDEAIDRITKRGETYEIIAP